MRRYACPMGHRYTTAEFVVADGNNTGRSIVREFREQMAYEGRESVKARLRDFLRMEAELSENGSGERA